MWMDRIMDLAWRVMFYLYMQYIDGKVYYSDNYRYCGMSEGSVIVKTISKFTNYFSYHYGAPTGAIYFVK